MYIFNCHLAQCIQKSKKIHAKVHKMIQMFLVPPRAGLELFWRKNIGKMWKNETSLRTARQGTSEPEPFENWGPCLNLTETAVLCSNKMSHKMQHNATKYISYMQYAMAIKVRDPQVLSDPPDRVPRGLGSGLQGRLLVKSCSGHLYGQFDA